MGKKAKEHRQKIQARNQRIAIAHKKFQQFKLFKRKLGNRSVDLYNMALGIKTDRSDCKGAGRSNIIP